MGSERLILTEHWEQTYIMQYVKYNCLLHIHSEYHLRKRNGGLSECCKTGVGHWRYGTKNNNIEAWLVVEYLL